ncbi:MAG TPA: cytochrome c oxidase subunit 4 [Candidatus Dormibacteraeota bacterium]|nr:cytochrome c oxidase subunit 4 [Candidatus Dormibacteraeota bacterium]
MSNEPLPTEVPEGRLPESSPHLPGPSFWPFLLAVGVAMSLIGVITKVEVVAGGLIIVLVSLTGWIREATHEYRSLP